MVPGPPRSTRTDILFPYTKIFRSRVRDAFFNSPNAPVSYPFLWDATRSDFVQWNGVASNALLGPLGRNTGEVIGVFAILDWHEDRGIFADLKRFNLSAWLSGQSSNQRVISFQSRSEERRVGKACVSTCSSRRTPDH